MKKIIYTIPLIICILLASAMPALAAPGTDDWNVIKGNQSYYAKYTEEGKWETNLDAEWDDPLSDLEPGDKVELAVDISNEYKDETYWYMKNAVLKSLETLAKNSKAHGGGYTYTLQYTNPAGETEDLFNSDVGGEDNTIVTGSTSREGLLEATNNLEEYFYLDTFKAGDKGKVMVTVALDGESQGNWYQDSRAELSLQFGVTKSAIPTPEPTPQPTTTPTPTPTKTPTPTPTPSKVTTTPTRTTTTGNTVTTTKPVKTGDSSRLATYSVIMGASAIVILLIALYLVKNRRRERSGR